MNLRSTALLDRDEERHLIRRSHSGDEDATARLVTSHLRYLRKEARRYGAASGVDRADLVAVGIAALLEAIVTFDLSRGTRLITHARYLVEEAMADEVAAYASAISVPGRTLRRYRKATRGVEEFDVAASLAVAEGMGADTFADVYAATNVVPLERPTSTDDDDGDAVQEGEPLGTRGALRVSPPDVRSRAAVALNALDGRSRWIIAATVMAPEQARMTDASAARTLGVSRATVGRLRRAALERMRAALEGAVSERSARRRPSHIGTSVTVVALVAGVPRRSAAAELPSHQAGNVPALVILSHGCAKLVGGHGVIRQLIDQYLTHKPLALLVHPQPRVVPAFARTEVDELCR